MEEKKKSKRTVRIVSVVLAAVFGIPAIIVFVVLCWGAAQRAKGSIMSFPVVPGDFVPTVRLVAFTDSHNKNDRVADAIDTAYALFDADPVYAGVDAFFGLGDFTSVGGENDFKNYAETLKAHVRPETICVTILGNHEMKNRKECVSLFKKYFGYDPNTVTDVKGFPCIAFSGERSLTEWTFTQSGLKWAKNSLQEAEKRAGARPVFVFQHPHNFGTVYGSTVWGNFQTNSLWEGHSKVVHFSGHSHFPMNDPRSMNQTTYTSVGIGSVSAFELEHNYIWGRHPDGYDTAAQTCVIEADDAGSVRIRGYDLVSNTFFCDYFIENVNDPSCFAYTYKNMKSHDYPPFFTNYAKASAKACDDGWEIVFTEAETSYVIHEYRVAIVDDAGKKVYSGSFLNDYYVLDGKGEASFHVKKKVLESGRTYTMRVIAESAYHNKSLIKEMTFVAQ